MKNQENLQFANGFEKEVHLSDYLNVVLRRWKIVLLVFLIVFTGVALKTFMSKPIYEAYATLEVRKAQNNGMLKELGMEDDNALSTEIEVLRSRTLAEKVARRLNLEWQTAEVSKGLDLVVGEFMVSAPLPGLIVTLDDPQHYHVSDLSGRVLGKGVSRESLQLDGVRLLISINQGAAGQKIVFERQQMELVTKNIIDSLSISEMGKGSNILRVASQNTDPGLARDVVNLLTEIYREANVAGKTEEAGMTVEFISQQLKGLKDVLDQSEAQLQEYKVQTGLATLSPEGNSLVQKLVELEQHQAELQLKRQRVESAISIVEEAIRTGGPLTVPTIEDSSAIAAAATSLADLDAQKKELLIDYTEAHPAVIEVQGQINRARKALLSNYQAMRQELLLTVRDLAKTIASYEAQLEDVPETELELAKRTRVNTVNAELYTFLLQKQQEASIAQASTLSNVRVVDPAATPQVPIKPNKKKNLALGLILGLMLGVGLSFLLDYMDQTIKTADDVRDKLGLNVFGIIPYISFQKDDVKKPKQQLVSVLQPKSPAVEAFRALRTNLNYLTSKEKHKVILITSAMPNEGKSTIAANLAVVMSQTGARVLLVGCDLRRPSLHELFGQPSLPGLVEMLIDDKRGALRKMVSPYLDLIPAGSVPPNPAELLDSERFRRFLNIVRQRYDYVIIDAPPVLPVTDAQILTPMVDINLVVLEPCRIPEKAALQMVASLRAVDARISGVILNDKTGRGFKHYGNYGYYGNTKYRTYYGESTVEEKPGMLGKLWKAINS